VGRKATSPVGTVGLPVSKGIVTMKLRTHTLIAIFFGLSFSLLADTLLFADTRSATVRVSCTIVPMIEMTAPNTSFQSTTAAVPEFRSTPRTELGLVSQKGLVSVKTNLGKNYSMIETLEKSDQGLLRLYSITAI